MSADARVAHAIKRVRKVKALRGLDPYAAVDAALLAEYESAVAELVDEAMDALHLTDDEINEY